MTLPYTALLVAVLAGLLSGLMAWSAHRAALRQNARDLGEAEPELPPKKLIHFDLDEAGRLQCDTAGCGYVEPANQPFTAALVGKPCPTCGASLLTERDYRDTLRQVAAIDCLNRWFGWLGTRAPDATHHGVRVRAHAGAIELQIRPPSTEEGAL